MININASIFLHIGNEQVIWTPIFLIHTSLLGLTYSSKLGSAIHLGSLSFCSCKMNTMIICVSGVCVLR